MQEPLWKPGRPVYERPSLQHLVLGLCWDSCLLPMGFWFCTSSLSFSSSIMEMTGRAYLNPLLVMVLVALQWLFLEESVEKFTLKLRIRWYWHCWEYWAKYTWRWPSEHICEFLLVLIVWSYKIPLYIFFLSFDCVESQNTFLYFGIMKNNAFFSL